MTWYKINATVDDGRNPAFTSWGKGSLSHYLRRVFATSQVFFCDFWTINSNLSNNVYTQIQDLDLVLKFCSGLHSSNLQLFLQKIFSIVTLQFLRKQSAGIEVSNVPKMLIQDTMTKEAWLWRSSSCADSLAQTLYFCLWFYIRKSSFPETNSSPLKINGWKRIVSFWDGLFSGAMLVLGSLTRKLTLLLLGEKALVLENWPFKNRGNLSLSLYIYIFTYIYIYILCISYIISI